MRISDWSSDVCSSDLVPRLVAAANRHPGCVIVGARLRKRAAQPVYRRIGNDFGDWGIGWGCGFRVVDSQSGQRLYPRAVYTLDDVPGEGFVFEAQMLISAARRAGAGVVAVPIETRYAGAGAPALMRKSHFRLFHDLRRITTHVVAQVRSEEHTSELQSLMRISYAVFCLKKIHAYSHTTYLSYMIFHV